MTMVPPAGAAPTGAAGGAGAGAGAVGGWLVPRTATGVGFGAVGAAGSIATWSGMLRAEEPSTSPDDVEPDCSGLRASVFVGIVSASEKTRTPIAASAADTRDIGATPQKPCGGGLGKVGSSACQPA